MKRREFFATLLATGAAARCAAIAAPAGVASIGLLVVKSPAAADFRRGLKEELRKLGYIEGQNVRFAFRSGEADSGLPELAAELVHDNVDVIVTWLTPSAMAAKAASRDIPIVMGTAGNPVETGLVASLSHPGGNVTGIAGVGAEVAGKLVEFIREMLPSAQRIAALCLAPDPFSKPYLASIQSSAAAAGVAVDPVWVQNGEGLDAAFASMARDHPDAIIAQPSLGLERPPELALRYRIPAVSIMREFAAQHAQRLTRRSVVLVVGDARTNYLDPAVDSFAAISERAGRVYWLNPELRRYWNDGDSVIGRYAPWCAQVRECRTLRQITDFVQSLAVGPGAALTG